MVKITVVNLTEYLIKPSFVIHQNEAFVTKKLVCFKSNTKYYLSKVQILLIRKNK